MTERIASMGAYRGDDEYIFVSYHHADAEAAEELRKLNEAGFNVWFDEGITPGARWTDELAAAIERCSVFLAFVTPGFVSSQTCMDELEFAVNRRRPLLAVHLVETALPPGLELSLGSRQAIHRYALAAELYDAKLREALRGLARGVLASRVPPGRPRRRRWGTLALTAGVGVAALLLATRLLEIPSSGVDSASRAAVGVLPFEVTSADPDDDYLSEGLAEDLAMRLGSWRSIPVIAPASMIREDLPSAGRDAARELNAQYLVSGRAQLEDGQLNVVAHLIDGETGTDIWSGRFAQSADNIFALQEQLSTAVVAQLNPALLQAESERAARKDPRTLTAWEAGFRGWWHVNRDTKEDLARARIWFERAIERDPTWGWPHATTALSYYRELVNGWSESPETSVGAMQAAAERAMALDPVDSFSHHALGHAYQRRGRVDEAVAAFARAVELTPYDAMANACYAMQLAASNKPVQAIEIVQHAMAISPKDPWSHWFALVMARAHFAAGDYPPARQWADRSLQLKPSFGAMIHSIAAEAMAGDVEAARRRVTTLRETRPLPPLSRIQQGFSINTESDYVSRLVDGLRLAGFDG